MIESPEQTFDIFRKAYKNGMGVTPRGNEVEFDYFIECCAPIPGKRRRLKWREELSRLLPAAEADIAGRKAALMAGKWLAEPQNLKTWLYNRKWTRDIPEKPKPKPIPDPKPFVPPATEEEKKEILSKAPWKRRIE